MIRSSSYTKEGILKQPDRATESDHDDDDNDVYNDVDVDEMDFRRDEYRRSMQSSSSLSHLVDSLIVHVPPEMDANDKTTMTSLSDVDYDEDDILGSDVLKRRRLFDDDDDAAAYDDDDDRRSSDANEETFCDGDNGFDDDDDDDEEEGGGEEVEGQLSEYWDQVNDKHLLDLK